MVDANVNDPQKEIPDILENLKKFVTNATFINDEAKRVSPSSGSDSPTPNCSDSDKEAPKQSPAWVRFLRPASDPDSLLQDPTRNRNLLQHRLLTRDPTRPALIRPATRPKPTSVCPLPTACVN
ncbi:UNVERIFIED_CONTAM: hypothetical protein FKN15_020472 [Acipenser sinensis]